MTFLLLVFFMVTTKITKDQIKLDVALPIASAARTAEDLSNREVVNVDGNGQLYIGDRPADMIELQQHLKRRLQVSPALRIYVRADARTDVAVVKKIMSAAADAGVAEVIFGSYNN